ncbi:MAG: aminoglycoside phosphotransferase family protein [Patescibacteria group bacterium]
MNTEIPLLGGRSTEGIVQIENTVHRPQGINADFIHSLLQHLEKKGFSYAPRFLGVDDKNREILSFIEGEVLREKNNWTDEQLTQVADLLREFHNSTAGSNLAGENEVVCHNDFAPWNLIFKNNAVVGIIDFDGAHPGKRSDEFAYAVWTFLNLGDNVPLERQIRRIKLMSNAYDFHNGPEFVESLIKEQEHILSMRKNLSINAKTEDERAFSTLKVTEFHNQIEWVKVNREVLAAIL